MQEVSVNNTSIYFIPNNTKSKSSHFNTMFSCLL